ncbi:MAG: hypothetical protein FJX77_06060 [Armatimonadetes bacterium]|nr:hypothetical protein [Armatimonadota bacterium]
MARLKRNKQVLLGLALFLWGTLVLPRGWASAVEPSAPSPPPAVQALLTVGASARRGRRFADGLGQAERALSEAIAVSSQVGEAEAHRLRALCLVDPGRAGEARSAWHAAAVAWEAVGDGPGLVEALAAQGCLLPQGGEAESLLQRCLQLARQELRRPIALADRLNQQGMDLWEQGRPRDGALHRAMATVARSAGWSHSFYWAPFLLIGHPGGAPPRLQ